MNERQKKFCDYYLKYNSLDDALLYAGYKTNGANKILNNKNVKLYLDTFKEKNEDIANTGEVMMCLTNIMRGKGLEEKITIKEKIKAAELLGKVYSIFSNKVEQETEENIFIIGSEAIKQ